MARKHDASCSGCPYCSTELAKLMSDAVNGRTEAVCDRLNEMSARDARRTGVTVASGTPGPPPDLGSAINARRDAPSTRHEAVKQGLAQGRQDAVQPSAPAKMVYVDDPR